MALHSPTLLSCAAAVLFCAKLPAEEKILYQKASAYSTIVVSEDEQGLRTLRFGEDGVRQSVVKLDDPDHLELGYARAMPAAMALVDQPQRVLIVGLGGGTIPRLLHAHFPQLSIDVVEIDPDVVAVAKQYFGFPEDERLRAYVDDGRRFIAQHHNHYDVIFLDAFSARLHSLSPGNPGIPVGGAPRPDADRPRRGQRVEPLLEPLVRLDGSSLMRTYSNRFTCSTCREPATRSCWPCRERLTFTQPDVVLRASRLSRDRGFRFDIGEVVKFGFREPGEDGDKGRVLTDNLPPAKAG